MDDLFGPADPNESLAPGAVLLRGRALPVEAALLAALDRVLLEAPFRHMTTPGGFEMSVAMTNCGAAGWVADREGYRYAPRDPDSQKPWPAMPAVFSRLAGEAAEVCGYPDFRPDACLINCYGRGARLSPHQDRDERDFSQPIVSVSLGLPATFQFGGLKRTDRLQKVPLRHGDVVVWGGPARLFFHGVLALKDGDHPKLGRKRINLTFRKAL